MGEPLSSSPTAGEALPKAPPSIEAEESGGGAKRREIDSSGRSGGVEDWRSGGAASTRLNIGGDGEPDERKTNREARVARWMRAAAR